MAGGGGLHAITDFAIVFAAGGAIGAMALYALLNLKSANIQFNQGGLQVSKLARAYPSYFWDLRDPGQTQANFDQKEYIENTIPREGLFSAPDLDFTQPNFSEFNTYTAPKSI